MNEEGNYQRCGELHELSKDQKINIGLRKIRTKLLLASTLLCQLIKEVRGVYSLYKYICTVEPPIADTL